MRSLTADIYSLLKHNEAGPFRHPLVVTCHLPYAAALALVYLLWAEQTAVQSIYFAIAIGLYVSSTAYHCWRPDAFIRFCDQTMIAWYILVAPLPFIHAETWAIPLFLTLATTTCFIKWYKLEADDDTESWIFLGLGIVSAGLMFGFGFERMGVTYWSVEGLLVSAAIVCFVSKWIIYHFQISLIQRFPNVWEPPEMGHCVLSWGVSIITFLVITHPT